MTMLPLGSATTCAPNLPNPGPPMSTWVDTGPAGTGRAAGVLNASPSRLTAKNQDKSCDGRGEEDMGTCHSYEVYRKGPAIWSARAPFSLTEALQLIV